ncbi:MAG: hypothetical protein WDN30_16795 [Pararobbsia sp.]
MSLSLNLIDFPMGDRQETFTPENSPCMRDQFGSPAIVSAGFYIVSHPRHLHIVECQCDAVFASRCGIKRHPERHLAQRPGTPQRGQPIGHVVSELGARAVDIVEKPVEECTEFP